jgi:cytoskeleton protein RodZ
MDIENTIAPEQDMMKTPTEPLKKTGFGLLLKKARESAQLTEKEAATRLYLNVNLIHIMENEDFDNAPPPTFMCGYLRSYGLLLNIPENEIKSAIKELRKRMSSTQGVDTPVLPPIPIKTRNDRYVSWITYLISILLIGLVSIWWITHSHYTHTDSTAKIITLPIATIATPSENTVAQTTQPATAVAQSAAPIKQMATPLPTASNSAKNSPTLANMAVSLPEPGLESGDKN